MFDVLVITPTRTEAAQADAVIGGVVESMMRLYVLIYTSCKFHFDFQGTNFLSAISLYVNSLLCLLSTSCLLCEYLPPLYCLLFVPLLKGAPRRMPPDYPRPRALPPQICPHAAIFSGVLA